MIHREKLIISILIIGILCFNIDVIGQSIYTNDMDYVVGDTKQAFITNMVKSENHADNLLKALKTMKFNAIRIPIFPRDAVTGIDINPNKPVMDYFYEQALAQGFLIFANPAQGGGGIRIANNSITNTSSVKGKRAATEELIGRIIEFSNEYPNCKWINPFNEDGRVNTVWSLDQINEIYQRLYTHGVNGAELIGPCTWGLPAGIDMLGNTKISDYITVASSHNLGHNDHLWDDFMALAKAKNLPVWDSEANNDPGNTDVSKIVAALANKVDGLVVYNAGNNVDLNTGGLNNTNLYYMSIYLKQRTNMALVGVASQSATTSSTVFLEASRAIDGNVSGDWNKGDPSFSHTVGTDPWWQVDLGFDKEIGEISIYNRTENRETLSDFSVSVINSKGEIVFNKVFESYPNPLLVIETGNVEGSIVKVQLNGSGTLCMSEVQILAPIENLSTKFMNQINFDVYPNPVEDSLQISLPNDTFKKYTIYNSTGRILMTQEISSNEFEIDTSEFMNGIYILKLEGDSFYCTEQIIKN